jgi:hypothetical protein
VDRLAVSPDAQIGAFVDAANTHPVFELTLTPSDPPGARISVSRRQGDGRTPQPRGPARSSGSSSPPALLEAIDHGTLGPLTTLGASFLATRRNSG